MEHVSLLNTSMGQFLQTSMNAAADITSLKENLGDFRKVLVTMFERLKSSAALFDEIRLLVSFISPTITYVLSPTYFSLQTASTILLRTRLVQCKLCGTQLKKKQNKSRKLLISPKEVLLGYKLTFRSWSNLFCKLLSSWTILEEWLCPMFLCFPILDKVF